MKYKVGDKVEITKSRKYASSSTNHYWKIGTVVKIVAIKTYGGKDVYTCESSTGLWGTCDDGCVTDVLKVGEKMIITSLKTNTTTFGSHRGAIGDIVTVREIARYDGSIGVNDKKGGSYWVNWYCAERYVEPVVPVKAKPEAVKAKAYVPMRGDIVIVTDSTGNGGHKFKKGEICEVIYSRSPGTHTDLKSQKTGEKWEVYDYDFKLYEEPAIKAVSVPTHYISNKGQTFNYSYELAVSKLGSTKFREGFIFENGTKVWILNEWQDKRLVTNGVNEVAINREGLKLIEATPEVKEVPFVPTHIVCRDGQTYTTPSKDLLRNLGATKHTNGNSFKNFTRVSIVKTYGEDLLITDGKIEVVIGFRGVVPIDLGFKAGDKVYLLTRSEVVARYNQSSCLDLAYTDSMDKIAKREIDNTITVNKVSGSGSSSNLTLSGIDQLGYDFNWAFFVSKERPKGRPAPEHKFKVGDKIIGNQKANKYHITKEGWKSTVTKVLKDGKIVNTKEWADLEVDCFDLYVEPAKKPEPAEVRLPFIATHVIIDSGCTFDIYDAKAKELNAINWKPGCVPNGTEVSIVKEKDSYYLITDGKRDWVISSKGFKPIERAVKPIIPTYKVGDIVIITDDKKTYRMQFTKGTICKITKITLGNPNLYEIQEVWKDEKSIAYLANADQIAKAILPPKFKVGDMVIGNEKANQYGITIKGWIGRVTKSSPSCITADDYSGLDNNAFDLYQEPIKEIKTPELIKIEKELAELKLNIVEHKVAVDKIVAGTVAVAAVAKSKEPIEADKKETKVMAKQTIVEKLQAAGKKVAANQCEIAKTAATLEAARVLNNQLVKVAAKKLPIMVRGYADTAMGKALLANILYFGMETALPDVPDTDVRKQVAQAAVVQSYQELLADFNIEGMIDELFNSKEMKALSAKITKE